MTLQNPCKINRHRSVCYWPTLVYKIARGKKQSQKKNIFLFSLYGEKTSLPHLFFGFFKTLRNKVGLLEGGDKALL